jgi:DNA polymerase-3 subunit delta
MTNPQTTGKVTILHGDDTLAMEIALSGLLKKAGLADGSTDLNLTTLEGCSFEDEAIATAASAMPMFGTQRVVVLKNPQVPVKKGRDAEKDVGKTQETEKKKHERFLSLISNLPQTTHLVIELTDEFKTGKGGPWVELGKLKWLEDWARNANTPPTSFKLPALRAMPQWIAEETTRQGGTITPAAATRLSFLFGNETQVLAQEIGKLLTYVDGQHVIDVKDVDTLCAYGGLGNIFEMMDAISEGKSAIALKHYHQLLEQQDILSIFPMVVRQFRLLILTREILEEHGNLNVIAHELRLPDFVADKLILQSRRFTMARLEAIYHQLLEMDCTAKNGGMELETALYVFIAAVGKG